MKYADAIATHKNASKGPDAFARLRQLGVKLLDTESKGTVRSAMILLLSAGYVTISKRVPGDSALFQATPELTPAVAAAAKRAAMRYGYDTITPRIPRGRARRIILQNADAPPPKAGP
jgi:hypothetical protein